MVGFLYTNVIQQNSRSIGGGVYSNDQGGVVTSGLFEDKAGDYTGFSSDENGVQQGSGSASNVKYGALDNVSFKLGGQTHRIRQFTHQDVPSPYVRLSLFHADGTDSSALPSDLFTAVSTELGVLLTAQASSHTHFNTDGNTATTVWQWNTPAFPNIISSTTGAIQNLTIVE